MKRRYYRIFVLFFTVLMTSCGTYGPQYKDEDDKTNTFPTKGVDKTFYLIGDAGKSPENGMSLGLTALNDYLKGKKTKGDFTIFLGDNIYPSGLHSENHKDRKEDENNLNAQFRAVEGFEGDVYFIPGNHEWYADGVKGVKEQEKFVEAALGKNTFKPENGCPIETIEVNDKIELIIIDTQWYLEDWNKHPTINDECEIKTRERFLMELEGELKKNQEKTIVLAMHHPMFTNGVHGGYYSWKRHIFPTEKNIPLPILSSLAAQIRVQGGISIQDRYNERYNSLMQRLEVVSMDYGKVIFVSGHEHNLQYIEKDGVKQIVSGSGAKESGAVLADSGVFATGHQGFVELTIFKDGSSWVKYFSAENGQSQLLFQKEVFPSKPNYDVSDLPDSFPNEVEVSIYTEEETDKSQFFKSFWGDHYRDVYSTKINAKVATLDTLKGGLEIVRPGGGHQTRSLRLKDKSGREYNMRALRKSATQLLQSTVFKDAYVKDQFEKTVVEDLILDYYTAAHPYAFAVVPDLSSAIDVYHTNPEIYYIPKHKYLKDFNKDYGNELYMIVERPEENYTNERTFGYADDLESTHDIIEKIREDEKYKIDQEAYVRARLFDMLIGDWDRHQDQWRWAQFDQENGDKIYKPIPRDRDQVFSNFDGAFLDVLKFISEASKQLQVYDAELKDLRWMNKDGILLDRVLSQQADRDMWHEQAKYIQGHITSDVIEKAFSRIPEEVRDTTILEIKKNFESRLSILDNIADRYYNILTELVVLTGTDKDDYIEIIREADNKTRVKISRIKDGEKADVLVDRVLDKEQTKEIWVYALDDKDVIEVSGDAKGLIYTRVIGGQNNDTYIIKRGKKVRVYDYWSKKNTIQEKKGGSVKFTDIYNLNLFDYKKTIVKQNLFTPMVAFNPDDGLLLGASFQRTIKGFQANPFSQQHRFTAGYYFATSGFKATYDGEFANAIRDWNLLVSGLLTTENYSDNFFGFGNETRNYDDELGLNYNRVRTGIYRLKAGLVKRGNFGSDYGFNVMAEGIEIEPSSDRFVEDYQPNLDSDFFDRRFFGTLEATYRYESYDKKVVPTRGMDFLFNVGIKGEFEDLDTNYGFVNTHLGFYNALSSNRKLVLKTKVASQLRIGDDFLFYQAAQIGDQNGLRGYRTERFTGRNSLVGSTDLRYGFNTFKTSFIPLQIGVFGGFDVGRVWVQDDQSDKWHNDYGGGFWIATAESLAGTVNLFKSSEGWRFTFGFGFDF
ncbi:metallophosphoesterase [Mangrovimonas sp. ST2L15]|uniref:metallophosphoesterase n=1 Tax=Mangrovimonas sp. ST2L15 TaxID=1645916 RepID=UPI00350F2750